MKCVERIESSLHSPNAHLPSEDVFWNWIMRMCGITSSSKMPSLSSVLSGQFGFGRVPQSHTHTQRGGKELGRVREREASGNQMNLIFNDALRLGKICCNICSWWDSKPEAGSCRVAMPFHGVCVCVCTVCNMQRVAHDLQEKYIYAQYTEFYLLVIFRFSGIVSPVWRLFLFQIHLQYIYIFFDFISVCYCCAVVAYSVKYIFLSVILIGLYIWSHASNNYSR